MSDDTPPPDDEAVVLLKEALAFMPDAFEGDTEINGADMVEWFSGWRERVLASFRPPSICPTCGGETPVPYTNVTGIKSKTAWARIELTDQQISQLASGMFTVTVALTGEVDVLREFVSDVEAAHGSQGQDVEEITGSLRAEWPDLADTYTKALGIIARADERGTHP